jgi:histidyl-tRNA synthetase
MSAQQRTSPASFIKHATSVAGSYGFRPARELEQAARDRLVKRVGTNSFDAVARVSSAYLAARPGEPALAYWASPAPLYLPHGVSPREMGEFGLQVVGAGDALGEVLLIKTLTAIASEWGASVGRVRVNAVGDRDSQLRFLRELGLYLRKHAAELAEECREEALKNPLRAYACRHETCVEVLRQAPRPMNFLSEKSRAHFRLVLEHLENLNLPYEIDDLLVGDERDAHFSFALDFEAPDATIVAARGGRFDEFLRRSTGRKESTGVGGSIFFKKTGASKETFKTKPPLQRPKVYFVQLGTRAKLQGLAVVDMLRAARIPLRQSFDSAHLSPQLTAAKTLGVSHMLIMGQREALDGTVIVRSTSNSSQTTVVVSDLPRILRSLK